MFYKLIIVFLALTSSSRAFSQEYSTKQGLPSNHIYHSIQDSKGYMWFATNRGVAKFDGVKFKVFTTKDGLPNNDIWKLTVDDKGRVWYNTKSKYIGYIENDSVYKFMGANKQVFLGEFWNINKGVVVLKEGSNLFVLGKDSISRLGKINVPKKDLKKRKKVELESKGYQINNFERNLSVVDLGDNIYTYSVSDVFFTNNKREVKSSLQNQKGTKYKISLIPNNSMSSCNEKGIVFLNSRNRRIKYYSSKELNNKIEFNGLPIIVATDKEVQLSMSGYLYILNQDFEIVEEYSFPNYPKNTNSFKDREGNIWLNNKEKGVVLIPNSKTSSIFFLKQKRIQKINRLRKKIFAGEQKKGIYIFNSKSNQFHLDDNFVIKKNIYQLKQNKKLNISYIISALSYVSYTDTISEKNEFSLKYTDEIFKRKTTEKNCFKDLEISNYFVYAILYNECIKFDLKSKKVIKAIPIKGLNSISSYKNKIYTGGSEGLFIYKNDSLVGIKPRNKELGSSINCMTSDEHFLYTGTDGRGVFLYDGKKYSSLKNTDGLIIQKIIRKNNKLWLATQEGVKVVDLNLENLEASIISNSFYDSDGLLENNTNDIYLEDSLLWIATDVGVSRINTKSCVYQKKSPVLFDFKEDTVRFYYSDKNQIPVDFHVLNYSNQDYLTYEYRLLPRSEEWIKTNTGTINFLGLPPNLYELEVKVTDQHKNVSIGIQFIHVLPVWWQTNWVRGGFLLLAGFILYCLLKYAQSRIRAVERKKTRLAGLELQALRSQMNPHFVHNSLNAIKYYIQRNEAELSEEYLTKFSQLIRLFFDYSRRESMSLKDELHLLKLYLEIEKLRFEDKLTFSIEVDEKIDTEESFVPSMILQPIIENAVNHGVFHKKGVGNVNLKVIYLYLDSYQVVVEDDGVGINKAKFINERSSENYKSKSSEVLKDRLDLLNQSNLWEVSYSILDLSELGKGQGTRVSLLFKQIQ